MAAHIHQSEHCRKSDTLTDLRRRALPQQSAERCSCGDDTGNKRPKFSTFSATFGGQFRVVQNLLVNRRAERRQGGVNKMPVVTILPSGKTVEAEQGSRLLDAILASGESIVSKCGGNAKCGQCHIFVQEGRKSLSRATREENEKLDTIVGVGSKSRLACQAFLGSENITVELLGFGSGF
jgi:2Fe-2S ferredoxin